MSMQSTFLLLSLCTLRKVPLYQNMSVFVTFSFRKCCDSIKLLIICEQINPFLDVDDINLLFEDALLDDTIGNDINWSTALNYVNRSG